MSFPRGSSPSWLPLALAMGGMALALSAAFAGPFPANAVPFASVPTNAPAAGSEQRTGSDDHDGPLPIYQLSHGYWFDGQTFNARTAYAVKGRLTFRRPATVDQVLDLQGGYVVPPFGEGHNHNVETPWNVDAVISAYLRDGVFYVKNTNNIAELARQIQGKINRPDSIDVTFANGGLTASGGHPIPLYEDVLRGTRYRPLGNLPRGWFQGRAYYVVDAAADLEQAWPAILRDKPDFLKVYLVDSGNAAPNSDTPAGSRRHGLDPRLLPRVVRKAHAAGLRVSAHVETAADFRAALAGGVDELTHVPGWAVQSTADAPPARLTEADAREAARRKVTVCTTTVALRGGGDPSHHPGHADGGAPASPSPPASPEADEVQRDNLYLLHQYGVRLTIGSDHAETSLAEVENLRRLGVFDALTVLRLWCEATPRAIFPGRKIGLLREGYEASFVVLRGNPLRWFPNVRRIALRMKQGHLLPDPVTPQPNAHP